MGSGPMGPGPMGPGRGRSPGRGHPGAGPSVSQEPLRKNGTAKKRPSGLRKTVFGETFSKNELLKMGPGSKRPWALGPNEHKRAQWVQTSTMGPGPKRALGPIGPRAQTGPGPKRTLGPIGPGPNRPKWAWPNGPGLEASFKAVAVLARRFCLEQENRVVYSVEPTLPQYESREVRNTYRHSQLIRIRLVSSVCIRMEQV